MAWLLKGVADNKNTFLPLLLFMIYCDASRIFLPLADTAPCICQYLFTLPSSVAFAFANMFLKLWISSTVIWSTPKSSKNTSVFALVLIPRARSPSAFSTADSLFLALPQSDHIESISPCSSSDSVSGLTVIAFENPSWVTIAISPSFIHLLGSIHLSFSILLRSDTVSPPRFTTFVLGNSSLIVPNRVAGNVAFGTIKRGLFARHLCIFTTVATNPVIVLPTHTPYANKPTHLFVKKFTHSICAGLIENFDPLNDGDIHSTTIGTLPYLGLT